MRALLAAAACVALGGCLRGSLPALRQYRLVVPDTTALARLTNGAGPSAPLLGSLGILTYHTPGLYADRSIVYRIGETEYGAYPSNVWALPLERMLGVITEQVLRAHPIASDQTLFDPPSRRSQTYLWVGTVREFEEVNRGTTVFAAVGLEARVLRAADDSVVWRGTVRLERPVPEGTMSAIVEALSKLAAEAVGELGRRAAREIPSLPAAATRGAP